MASVEYIGHINLRAAQAQIERLRAFYRDVIGLREGSRPPFRSQGYWLYAGEQDIVHLSIDPHAPEAVFDITPRPALNHIAFACRGLEATQQRLREAGVAFHVDRTDSLDQVQLFLRDPCGTGIELTFTGESPDMPTGQDTPGA